MDVHVNSVVQCWLGVAVMRKSCRAAGNDERVFVTASNGVAPDPFSLHLPLITIIILLVSPSLLHTVNATTHYIHGIRVTSHHVATLVNAKRNF